MKNTANDLNTYDNETLVGTVFWTFHDCAKQLKMSERKLARLHTERKGPPRIRIGQRLYYARESVLAWLKSLEEPTPDVHQHKRRRFTS